MLDFIFEDDSCRTFILITIVVAILVIWFLIKSNKILEKENLSYKANMQKMIEQQHKNEQEKAELNKIEVSLEKRYNQLIENEKTYKAKINEQVEKLLQDKSISMPWLATMVSDFYKFFIDESRCTVTNVSELKHEIAQLKKENRLLTYKLDYAKSLLPEIEDEIEVAVNDEDTPLTEYLSEEEYKSLSDTEKNKLALERYKNSKNRGKHNIGRDFEMFVGYQYEKQGFKVTYFGIEQKIHDLGIDIIAEDKNRIFIIQCKYWNKHKTIYEKYICQLYGTTMKYRFDTKTTKIVKPLFICHNELSETAKDFARSLNILVSENVEIGEYPLIKCYLDSNIYHLPFDLQYDKIKRENCKLVSTIEEAEALGCRRAYPWHSNSSYVMFSASTSGCMLSIRDRIAFFTLAFFSRRFAVTAALFSSCPVTLTAAFVPFQKQVSSVQNASTKSRSLAFSPSSHIFIIHPVLSAPSAWRKRAVFAPQTLNL